MRVLVTGAAGYFASQILPALLADSRISGVVATDRQPIALRAPKLRFAQRDLVRDDPADLLASCEAVIHLAFRVERRPGEDLAAINVEAHQRFLREATQASEVLVVASSLAAYGLRETPFEKLREDDPVAPDRGMYYCAQKIAAERLLDQLGRGAPSRIVRARPCAVGGPTIDRKRALQFAGKLQLAPRVEHPLRLQLLHEADLGSAFLALLFAPAGAYNVAPDDALPLAEAAAIAGQTLLTVPRWLYRGACDLSWRLGANALDAAWARMNDYPSLVGDNAKLRALGWQPTRTTADAVRDTAQRVRSRP